MNILGPDTLVFGVDDIDGSIQYLTDFGLAPVGRTSDRYIFEAMDGTGIVLAHKDDPELPPGFGNANMLRKTIYGVDCMATLDAIAAEVGRDRPVRRLADGSIELADDMGFVLGFQVTTRRAVELPAEIVNGPGARVPRAVNVLGIEVAKVPKPRTLSHVVLFVPDIVKAEAFYVERLGFICTDRFTGVGPFLRPAGTLEHHTLFMIQTPPFMKGCEHFAFHMGGPSEVMQAGTRFAAKGYQSFWGPGRHIFGSNWFWYFNSPLGCHVEFDADMDLHDKHWSAREAAMGADNSQAFLFAAREKWAPGGPAEAAH